jgi:hypothetical protein
VARTAAVQGLPVSIVTELLKGAAYQGGKIVFGRLLETFGLANPPVSDTTESELAAIRTQLDEIQGRLTALGTAVTQLRAEVAESEYSVLVGQTTPITSAINTGMDYLDALAKTPASDPAKKGFTEATLEFIKTDLLHKQAELAKKITGDLGSDGLIKAFSKALKARTRYWTNRTSQQVGEVYDYYQSEEARLLLLRVEYWHAHPNTYPASYIEGEIKKVEQELGTQKADLLKPSPGFDVFADTRTDLDWGYHDLHYAMTGVEAIDQVARYNGSNAIWYMPVADQVRDLVRGWQRETLQPWMYWLNDEIGGQAQLNNLIRLVRTPTGWLFETDVSLDGVWLHSPGCGVTSTSLQGRTQDVCRAIDGYLYEKIIANDQGGVEFLPAPHRTYDEGLLIYRYRTHTYWW